MTTPHQGMEQLESLAERYRARGYTVEVATLIDGLPVDLVARKGSETVLVELKNRRPSEDGSPPLESLAQLASSRGWRFIIAIPGRDGAEEIEAPTEHDVRRLISEARSLGNHHPNASLLVAWSAFEAAGRFALASGNQVPTRSSASPTAVVQTLTSLGYLDRDEEQKLIRASASRNRAAHGFSTVVDVADVSLLASIAERLLERQRAA